MAEEYAPILSAYYKDESTSIIDYIDNSDTDIKNLISYCIVDKEKNVIKNVTTLPYFDFKFQSIIDKWVHHQRSIRVSFVSMPDNSQKVIIFTAKTIFDEGNNSLGRIYIARDITSDYRMLVNLVFVLLIIAVIFTMISTIISYFFAGNVIKPFFFTLNYQKKFMTDVSHELRTPLMVLLTSIDYIENDDTNIISADSSETLECMQNEIKRMSNIIGDLVLLAKSDCGDINVHKEDFLVNNLVNQILNVLKPIAKKKNVKLQLVSDEEFKIFADKQRISQLFFILLDNAIKYNMENGFVNIKIAKSKTHMIDIVIQDTGIGIPVDSQQKVFQRFYRDSKVQIKGIEGSGLGLSIARWIVNTHGGIIKMKSSEKEGTTFYISI